MRRESILCKLLLIVVLGWNAFAFAEYEWIYNQIENDFASYEGGISEEQLDLTMELGGRYDQTHHWWHRKGLVRVKVINGVLYIFGDEGIKVSTPAISDYLKKIIEKEDLPDLDFVYCNYAATDHEDDNGISFPGPVLSGNKREGCTNVILYHDRMVSMKTGMYSWEKAFNEVEQFGKNIPWEKKNNKLVWYGKVTDFDLKDPEGIPILDNSKRLNCYHLSVGHPRLMDVGITHCWLLNKGYDLGVPIASFKDLEYHLRNKYQIVFDGLTCTNPGYAWRLFANCTCLKVDSSISQWFYAGLIEGEHYLSIEADLSNLVETIELLRANDRLARKIAVAGRKWAKKNLVEESLLIEYLTKVLKKYASLQNFDPALTLEEKSQYFPDEKYEKLKRLLPFNDHGLFCPENAEALSFLINKFSCKTVVELGSSLGKSTRHIARLLPDDGVIFAIDHWKEDRRPQASHRNDLVHSLSKPYEQFLSNCIHSGLTHKIIPKRLSTLTAAKRLCVQPDLVYVDTTYDEESFCKGLKAWYAHLKSNGILCGNGWGSGAGSPVRRAVTQFAKEQGLFIETHGGHFWMLKKSFQKILPFRN